MCGDLLREYSSKESEETRKEQRRRVGKNVISKEVPPQLDPVGHSGESMVPQN